MHSTALENCERFFIDHVVRYRPVRPIHSVLDVGSYDVNGSVKPIVTRYGGRYTGLDIEAGPGVDVVLNEPGAPFPFEDRSFDVVVSTSCLEHDPAFWLTVAEMMRVSSQWIYLNVPSAQQYHAYPIDCWRFMLDSMGALAKISHDWRLVESYVDDRKPWCDCVGVFGRA